MKKLLFLAAVALFALPATSSAQSVYADYNCIMYGCESFTPSYPDNAQYLQNWTGSHIVTFQITLTSSSIQSASDLASAVQSGLNCPFLSVSDAEYYNNGTGWVEMMVDSGSIPQDPYNDDIIVKFWSPLSVLNVKFR